MPVSSASVTVSLDRRLGTISPRIYGTTWDWRDSAWGGIWVGDHASIPHIDGFRTEAIEALRALDLPVVQFFLLPLGRRRRTAAHSPRAVASVGTYSRPRAD